jgi:hypothetical protein
MMKQNVERQKNP